MVFRFGPEKLMNSIRNRNGQEFNSGSRKFNFESNSETIDNPENVFQYYQGFPVPAEENRHRIRIWKLQIPHGTFTVSRVPLISTANLYQLVCNPNSIFTFGKN